MVGDRVVYAQSALGALQTVHNVLADKAAVPARTLSFEQAAASFPQRINWSVLLAQNYEIKPVRCLFSAPLRGLGTDSLSVGESAGGETLSYRRHSAQKAQRPKRRSAWQVINYREESIVERLKVAHGR
ncbi:hypothetical protein LAD77_01725 [Klebsiella pneumoniae]|nr:hypothetical protein [Klebsiella pneumoniae]